MNHVLDARFAAAACSSATAADGADPQLAASVCGGGAQWTASHLVGIAARPGAPVRLVVVWEDRLGAFLDLVGLQTIAVAKVDRIPFKRLRRWSMT